MLICANKNEPNALHIFQCEYCDFKCSKNSDYGRHLLTRKHIKAIDANSKSANYSCVLCNKIFKHAPSLSRHKKKCNNDVISNIDDKEENIVELLINENKDFKNVIIELIKSNTDLQKQMIEVCQNGIGSGNNNISNSHNKTFNMNFFLNEQCKDAMNIMDFVDTFKLDFDDLASVGKLGYVEGISGIIIKKLNEMDIYKRPIHCSDLKRETTHVKDRGVWEKDNGNHDKIRRAIRHITKKNSDMLNPWIDAHPQAHASAHYLNDVYLNYVRQSMGGKGDLDENEAKIIRKIAKAVLIDK